MSHAATNWAIRQRGLKPAAKIVLWHLADRHNGDTGQCNPSQKKLADDCEMARSTLNLHLDELERRGLIQRIVTIDHQTKRQRPTAYRLVGFDAETVSENRTRQGKKPCPKNAESRVRKSDTKNPVREPKTHARGETPPPAACESEQVSQRTPPPDGQREWLGVLAEKLKEGAYVAPSALRPDQAREMIQRGLVTDHELRRAGITF